MLSYSLKHLVKFQKTTLITSMTMVCVALIGCSREPEKPKESAVQVESKPVKTVDCKSPNATSSIQQAVINKIQQQTTNIVKQLNEQAELSIDINQVNDSISQLLVNVQNARPVNNSPQCQVTIAITLPEADIKYANQIYKNLQQPTFIERLNAQGLALENNTVVADNIIFNLNQIGDSFQVASVNAGVVMNEVSDVLANSQLRQVMLKNQPAVVSKKKTVSQSSNEQPARQQQPAKPQAERTTEEKQPSKPTPKPENTTPPKRSDSDNTSNDDKSTATTSEKPTMTVPPEKPIEKSEKPAEAEKPQAVPNDELKLTIKEKDEEY